MTGTGDIPATHEIHHFLLPLNPDNDTLQRYFDLVEQWNQKHPSTLPMKPCYLALIYRKDGIEEEVCVMQSARYFRSNDTDLVIEQCKNDTHFFESNGFTVVREKIEASAYGINGIPLTDDVAQKYPKYFEFHIKVKQKDTDEYAAITKNEVNQLKSIATLFTKHYNIPIPLSYNKVNKDGKGHQRFLNARFREQGLNTIKPKVDSIKNTINETSCFTVTKVISEYVWYDTNTQMDHGWIDFTPEEFAKALAK